ncbi:MAG: V-type ATPase subunit, partial [Clostridia bacterium]|nr:V-type ATPase subunit [Clostridia bacterium]
LYRHLNKVCSKNRLIKKFIADKADMTNILIAMRSADSSFAEKFYVEGGNIPFKSLESIFSGEDAAYKAIKDNKEFLKMCFEAKAEGKPMTRAERTLASYEEQTLALNKYDLKANLPFLYYALRRRAENENVRIIFVCLLNSMPEREIKSRLRGVGV